MTPRKKNVMAKPEPPRQEIRQSPDFESIYANWIQATFSAHEISLIVGQSFPVGPGVQGVEQKARIMFSAIEGKMLSVILRKILDTYETQFGKIVIPHVIGDPLVEQLPELKEMMTPKMEGD